MNPSQPHTPIETQNSHSKAKIIAAGAALAGLGVVGANALTNSDSDTAADSFREAPAPAVAEPFDYEQQNNNVETTEAIPVVPEVTPDDSVEAGELEDSEREVTKYDLRPTTPIMVEAPDLPVEVATSEVEVTDGSHETTDVAEPETNPVPTPVVEAPAEVEEIVAPVDTTPRNAAGLSEDDIDAMLPTYVPPATTVPSEVPVDAGVDDSDLNPGTEVATGQPPVPESPEDGGETLSRYDQVWQNALEQFNDESVAKTFLDGTIKNVQLKGGGSPESPTTVEKPLLYVDPETGDKMIYWVNAASKTMMNRTYIPEGQKIHFEVYRNENNTDEDGFKETDGRIDMFATEPDNGAMIDQKGERMGTLATQINSTDSKWLLTFDEVENKFMLLPWPEENVEVPTKGGEEDVPTPEDPVPPTKGGGDEIEAVTNTST